MYLISSPNTKIGVLINEFHELWWICECRRIYLENNPWDHRHTLQTSKPTLERDSARETCWKQLKMESKSFHQRVGPTYHRDRLASPTCSSAGLWVPPVSVSFLRWFPTAFESPSPLLIKVGWSNGDQGSWRGLMKWWFLAHYSTSIPCPLLHLGLYIAVPTPFQDSILKP